eukprot:scaffold59590_cov28-Tisochrysis_lutea.AAC.1
MMYRMPRTAGDKAMRRSSCASASEADGSTCPTIAATRGALPAAISLATHSTSAWPSSGRASTCTVCRMGSPSASASYASGRY